MEFLIKYKSELISLSGSIIAPIFAAIFAVWFFYRQKEYDTVRKRYLENGIDLLIQKIETALFVFQFNWTRSSMLLRTFRDLGRDTPKDLYNKGFLPLDFATIEATRHYLLTQLIGDNIFYEAHQVLLPFLHSADNFFHGDLTNFVRVYIEGGTDHNFKIDKRSEIVDEYISKLKELEKDSHRFWIMLGNLQLISFEFERQRFTFKKLENFKNNGEIKVIINRIKSLFKDELDKLKET